MSAATTPLRVAVRAQRRGHRARTTAITAGLAALAFALFVATMMIGTFRLTAWEVVGSVFRLTDDPSVDFIVLDLRLPTAATAVGVGLALGVAGLVYVGGVDMLWFPIGYTLGYVALLGLVAAPLRRSGAYTASDFAESRLDDRGVRSISTREMPARSIPLAMRRRMATSSLT